MLDPVRKRLRGGIDSRRGQSPPSIAGLDPGKSKCFPVENALSIGGIRVNLKGREPDGIISPGAEMEAFCEDLSLKLLEIIDYDTGIPMIKSVRRTSEMYQGEALDHLPDLLVEWSDEKLLGAVGSGSGEGSTVRLASDKDRDNRGCEFLLPDR